MRTLSAGELTLEPLETRHAARMFDVLSDPAIYEYENQPPQSLQWLTERYRRLESRKSPDGDEQWLNWVVVLDGEPLGYVQATLIAEGRAWVAYEFASAYWGRGLASRAVRAVIEELATGYGVRTMLAVLVGVNHRSMRLLERLGFARADAALGRELPVEPGEILMVRRQQPRDLSG